MTDAREYQGMASYKKASDEWCKYSDSTAGERWNGDTQNCATLTHLPSNSLQRLLVYKLQAAR